MQIQRPFAVVSPTLDADLLGVLAPVTAWFTTGQLERVLGDRSISGIRITLARLVEQGIVESERVGRVGRYRFNREHIAAEPLLALANVRTVLVNRMEALVQAWAISPVYAAAFGSMVRGQMRLDSDLDVFFVRSNGEIDQDAWDAQLADFSEQVTRWTGNDARSLQMSELEVAAGTVASGDRPMDPVLVSIASEALTIFGPTTWLRRLVGSGRLTRGKN